MIRLGRSLEAWGGSDFEVVLKAELVQLGGDYLPLQQGLSRSDHVAESPITLVVHGAAETEDGLRIRVGIFYQGISGGCACADDPTSSGECNEYCEVRIDIDKATALATIVLIDE